MVVVPPQPVIADPTTPLPLRNHGDLFSRGLSTVHFEYVEELYAQWPSPVCIIADGPYGLNGFPGDLPTIDGLVDWYRPHVKAWSERIDARNYVVVLELGAWMGHHSSAVAEARLGIS